VRSVSKGDAVKSSLESDASVTQELKIDVWELDMMNFASVAAFAERCKREGGKIDVAVMNAGKVTQKYELSPDGWESVLQVNVLSTALLSCLLLPLLVESAKSGASGGVPHLVIVGSDAHYQALLPERKEDNILEALNTEISFKGHEFDRYCVSKLFDSYIAIELAKLVPMEKGSPVVVVNSVTPGFCSSGLLAQSGQPPLVLRIFQWLLARSPDKGALCYVDAAIKGEESHGKYLNHQVVYRYIS
jgi:NAD(P)-dependent dehydrogenase (short-subunit alcohol dehydrogenase family)